MRTASPLLSYWVLWLYGFDLLCRCRQADTELFCLSSQHVTAALVEPLTDEGIPLVHAALTNDELIILSNCVLIKVVRYLLTRYFKERFILLHPP